MTTEVSEEIYSASSRASRVISMTVSRLLLVSFAGILSRMPDPSSLYDATEMTLLNTLTLYSREGLISTVTVEQGMAYTLTLPAPIIITRAAAAILAAFLLMREVMEVIFPLEAVFSRTLILSSSPALYPLFFIRLMIPSIPRTVAVSLSVLITTAFMINYLSRTLHTPI